MAGGRRIAPRSCGQFAVRSADPAAAVPAAAHARGPPALSLAPLVRRQTAGSAHRPSWLPMRPAPGNSM